MKHYEKNVSGFYDLVEIAYIVLFKRDFCFAPKTRQLIDALEMYMVAIFCLLFFALLPNLQRFKSCSCCIIAAIQQVWFVPVLKLGIWTQNRPKLSQRTNSHLWQTRPDPMKKFLSRIRLYAGIDQSEKFTLVTCLI